MRPVSKQYRADAGEIRDALDKILDKVSNQEGYSVTGKSRIQLPPQFNRQRNLAMPTVKLGLQAVHNSQILQDVKEVANSN
jgi:hypothetical protein